MAECAYIDVLVAGAADPDDVYDAARAAETRLGREVDVTLVTAARWAEPGDDPFLTGLRRRPLVRLDGERG